MVYAAVSKLDVTVSKLDVEAFFLRVVRKYTLKLNDFTSAADVIPGIFFIKKLDSDCLFLSELRCWR